MSKKRSYQASHPWIKFELDLRRLGHETWMLLGEARSKIEHVCGVPLLPHVAAKLLRMYLAKGAAATTAIENNTLTEQEVNKLIEGELHLPPSREYLGQEVANIIDACKEISFKLTTGEPTTLDVKLIKQYNANVLHNLPPKPDVQPGKIREHSVGVGSYRGAPAEDCEFLLQRLCEWIDGEAFESASIDKISFALLKAIVAHIYIAWIHPFGDGNGRTARLVEYHILLSAGVPLTSAHLLSNFYNQTRSEYYRQLDISHRSGGDIFDFLFYALQGFVDGIKEELNEIRDEQMRVHWINYIHRMFKHKESEADMRRRRLILDLTDVEEAVPMHDLPHITPRVAGLYANKQIRTLQRDVQYLEDLWLIRRTKDRIQANEELMQAFLSPKRRD